MSEPVCPLLQEPGFDTGWEVTTWITLDGKPMHRHLVPCCDLRRHQLDPTCWCAPTEDEVCAAFWIHNAADEREKFEEGLRRPS